MHEHDTCRFITLRQHNSGTQMYSMRLSILAACTLLFVSCSPESKSPADMRFEQFATRFIEAWLSTHPEEATALGDERFDHLLNDYSRAGIERDIAFFKSALDTLRSITVEDLSAAHMIDYDILRHKLVNELFALQELREWEWNPLHYNPGSAIYHLLARPRGTPDELSDALIARLHAFPSVFKAARENLTRPPAIHTETALLQIDGAVTLLNKAMQSFIDSLPPDSRRRLSDARDDAVTALQAYSAWMSSELAARSDGDFRLGTSLYSRKFSLRMDTDMTADELLASAQKEMERTKEELYRTALTLFGELYPDRNASDYDRSYVIREVLGRISDSRPSDQSIVALAEQYVSEATEFVKAIDIVTVPADPIEIIVMPEFQRGVAVAYCDSPGPLEKNGKTFFAIAPTPTDWTKQRKESFYREYNDYMLKNLVVHEAMPGHYLQLAAANQVKAPTLLRHIMPSGVFAEGWATYCEQIMADAGFGGPETKMQQLKMRLRLLINAIIDQGIHMRGMSEEEAMHLMMTEGFQEESEAAGKWRRACLTSVQLSTYYYGNIGVNNIRRRYELSLGEKFDIKKFHDALLSHGTISPKYFQVLFKLPVVERATPPA